MWSTRVTACVTVTVGVALTWKLFLRRRPPRVPEHVRAVAAAVDGLVLASTKHRPVPPLQSNHMPTDGWVRCTDAMAAVDARPHQSDDIANANDQVLMSSCSIDRLNGSRAKQCADALLAKHAKLVFPDLPATMAADPTLVILLLEAPNMLTTTALTEAFPALRTAALASRVCIPQADPAHYSLMVTESHLLCNVRFQRLDTWLASNAGAGLRVPIFFADYETSVYGRRSMRLSPLRDLQRFLRHGFAGSKCLLGLTLAYRQLHRDHYPADAPALTHEDVEAFVQHEATCAGMASELLECYRYGMVFSLFLLTRRDIAPEAARTTTTSPPTAPTISRRGTPPSAPCVVNLGGKRWCLCCNVSINQGFGNDQIHLAGRSHRAKHAKWLTQPVPQPNPQVLQPPPPTTPSRRSPPRLASSSGVRERPRQSRLIHGHEHVVRRWRELGFVVGGGGVRQALILTRELLADPTDCTRIAILSINRSEEEIPSYMELRDLVRLYPSSRLRVAFSLTEGREGGWGGFVGRGDCAMGTAALPSPLCTDADGSSSSSAGAFDENRGVMIIVCGKVQGDQGSEQFVEHWGGAMGKKLPYTRRLSDRQRVQGALGGVLREIGFSADQVFKY